ncbi:MAG TPA: FAD-linked oxidase C-terminal domain-containing protein [Dehalococcoidales bacterium]|nr:FAD-linked oxidase C-terminal domain-containing protein [Dehalococcoidales bacterium]
MDASQLDQLRRIVGKENLLTTKEDLIAYSYDAMNLWSHKPDCVVLPVSVKQISEVLKFANENKIPVTPRGGGTNVSGGSIPIKGGVVLGTNRLNKIIEINKNNLNATVEPGVILQDFNNALAKQGLFFPPDPQSAAGCTMGGVVSENSGGPSCLKYGVTKQYVLGLEVVLADGRIVKLGGLTPKNRTGYELMMLFTGSEGTLGIITRITLRLIPAPPAERTVVAVFKDVAVAGEAVSEIIAAGILPSKAEFVDNYTFDKFRTLISPEVLAESQVILLIQVDGLAEAVDAEARNVFTLAQKFASDVKMAGDKAQAAPYWAARSAHFSDISSRAPTIVNDDVSVPRDRLVEFINRSREAAKQCNVPLSFAGHIGDGNFHPVVLTDSRDKEHFERAHKCVDQIIEIALSLGGVISGEHGIGLEKARFLKKAMDPVAIELMRKIKDVLDPNHILNPGKIWEEA